MEKLWKLTKVKQLKDERTGVNSGGLSSESVHFSATPLQCGNKASGWFNTVPSSVSGLFPSIFKDDTLFIVIGKVVSKNQITVLLLFHFTIDNKQHS